MFLTSKSVKPASARVQIDILGVQNGVLVLRHGLYRMAIEVSSINFELKSEAEQDALIDIYESFLNSLSCPLQLLIRTRELDMDKYLEGVEDRLSPETERIYVEQLKNYKSFIRGLIDTNKILTRRFYVVVPFDTLNHSDDFEFAQEQLRLNVDIVEKGLSRLGIRSKILTSLEVLDLFYSFYDFKGAKLQPITAQTINLLHSSYTRGVDDVR